MKMFLARFLFLPVVFFITFTITGYSFQGGGREPNTPKGNPPRTVPKPPPGPKPAPGPKTPTVGQLVIRSKPVGCSIFLNGRVMGSTDQEGMLTLSAVKPGEHILIVRKPTYNEEKRTIRVYAGQSDVQEFFLSALPGKLTVMSSVTGARVQIPGLGEYQSPITNLAISPGQHQITISKPGYRRITREIEIKPDGAANLSVTLEPLSATEILVQVESDFRANSYDQVIATGRTILATQPDQPRANYLVGMSYYNADKYLESVVYLVKAISGGERVILPIKHHHRTGLTGLEDNLCNGYLSFQKASVEFHSNQGSGHDFNVPLDKIYELRNEWQKSGRVHLKVGIPKGNKEDKKDYNFHVTATELRSDGKITNAYCFSPSCQPMAEALYQLLQQLKR